MLPRPFRNVDHVERADVETAVADEPEDAGEQLPIVQPLDQRDQLLQEIVLILPRRLPQDDRERAIDGGGREYRRAVVAVAAAARLGDGVHGGARHRGAGAERQRGQVGTLHDRGELGIGQRQRIARRLGGLRRTRLRQDQAEETNGVSRVVRPPVREQQLVGERVRIDLDLVHHVRLRPHVGVPLVLPRGPDLEVRARNRQLGITELHALRLEERLRARRRNGRLLAAARRIDFVAQRRRQRRAGGRARQHGSDDGIGRVEAEEVDRSTDVELESDLQRVVESDRRRLHHVGAGGAVEHVLVAQDHLLAGAAVEHDRSERAVPERLRVHADREPADDGIAAIVARARRARHRPLPRHLLDVGDDAADDRRNLGKVAPPHLVERQLALHEDLQRDRGEIGLPAHALVADADGGHVRRLERLFPHRLEHRPRALLGRDDLGRLHRRALLDHVDGDVVDPFRQPRAAGGVDRREVSLAAYRHDDRGLAGDLAAPALGPGADREHARHGEDLPFVCGRDGDRAVKRFEEGVVHGRPR